MLRHPLRVLGVAALAAAACASPSEALTPLGACGAVLDKAGETYVLTNDVTANELVCFLIEADRVTLDLKGHTISGPGLIPILDSTGFTSTVVKNGTVTGFASGISLAGSRATIRNVNASGNGAFGIAVGPNSLVKDCTLQTNGAQGIIVGDGGQVENCVIGGIDLGNRGTGVQGGQRVLVTRNTVAGNGFGPATEFPDDELFHGIDVGAHSTMTNNTASGNGLSGIRTGTHSLVTGNIVDFNGTDGIVVAARSTVTSNTVNDNAEDGIDAACPSTILNNELPRNGGQPIHTTGSGCVRKGNVIINAPE